MSFMQSVLLLPDFIQSRDLSKSSAASANLLVDEGGRASTGVASYPTPPETMTSSCSASLIQLNERETTLRGSDCSAQPRALQGCLSSYSRLLAAQGATGKLAADRDVLKCRTRALGEDLCNVARPYLAAVSTDKGKTSGTWHRYFAELNQRETSDKDCARFDQYNKLGWKPYVFRWTEKDGYEALHHRMAFFADPDYARWAPAIERTDYGPPDRTVAVTIGLNATRHALTTAGRLAGKLSKTGKPAEFPAGSRFYQGGSLQMAAYLRALYLSAGRFPPDFPLILEFGAGSAELVPVTRSLGFSGAFVVYDLPPMLLMQRYVQRYSGYSAHLVGPDIPPELLNVSRRHARAKGTGLVKEAAGTPDASAAVAARPRLLRGHTTLVSSLHRTADGSEYLPLVLAGSGAELSSSLFYAAYSLTEAPPNVRDALRPTMRRFGTILVTFSDLIQGFNNDKWIASWVRDDLLSSHYVCSWKVPHREPDFGVGRVRSAYFVIATLREGGKPITCREDVGCTAKSKHKRVPMTC